MLSTSRPAPRNQHPGASPALSRSLGVLVLATAMLLLVHAGAAAGPPGARHGGASAPPGSVTPAQLRMPAADIDVSPTDDGYTVRGSLLLTDGFTGSSDQRRQAAVCPDCTWRITDFCPTRADGDVINVCIGTTPACRAGTVRMRVWRAREGEPFQPWGSACIGPAGPVTVREVTSRLREEVPIHLPQSAVRVHPPVALTRLPVWFADDIEGPQTMTVQVLGIDVAVRAEPVCTWRVSPRESTWTTVGVAAGCAVPVGTTAGTGWSGSTPGTFRSDAAHVFRRPGVHPVRLDVDWHARWWLPGEDDVPGQWVEGIVSQQPRLGSVVVRDAVGILRTG